MSTALPIYDHMLMVPIALSSKFKAAMGCHKRGPWSQDEDAWLLQLVATQGAHNWVRISHIIGTRTPKQCRERFHQNLKPTLNHEPITPEEVIIERLVGEMGKRWAEIARRLRGRSDNAVKNWWNGGMNRRRRLVGRNEGSMRQQDHFNEQTEHISFARPIPHIGRSVRNIYIPPTHKSLEVPLISPATSESISDAPSLVSDHGSQFSPSPKIEKSPSILLPPPVDTRTAAYSPNTFPRLQIAGGSTAFSFASPPIKTGETSASSPEMNNSLSQLAEIAAKHTHWSGSFPPEDRSSYDNISSCSHYGMQSSRDTRMNLTTLLT